jgi:hypothetical protein
MLAFSEYVLRKFPTRVTVRLTYPWNRDTANFDHARANVALRVDTDPGWLRNSRDGEVETALQMRLDEPTKLVQQIAAEILHQVDPYVLADYEYRHKHSDQAAPLLDETHRETA